MHAVGGGRRGLQGPFPLCPHEAQSVSRFAAPTPSSRAPPLGPGQSPEARPHTATVGVMTMNSGGQTLSPQCPDTGGGCTCPLFLGKWEAVQLPDRVLSRAVSEEFVN